MHIYLYQLWWFYLVKTLPKSLCPLNPISFQVCLKLKKKKNPFCYFFLLNSMKTKKRHINDSGSVRSGTVSSKREKKVVIIIRILNVNHVNRIQYMFWGYAMNHCTLATFQKKALTFDLFVYLFLFACLWRSVRLKDKKGTMLEFFIS